MAFKAVVHIGGAYTAYELIQHRSKGVRPYREPLPYYMYVHTENDAYQRYPLYGGNTFVGWRDPNYVSFVKQKIKAGHGASTNDEAAVWNKALSKLDDKLSYVTNLYEAWHERKEAMSLLQTALKAFLTLLKRWKDPRYWAKMREATGKSVRDPKSFPEAWLLWNFAIKPLVGTIEDVLKLLCRDFPSFWVEGTSGKSFSSYYSGGPEGVQVHCKTFIYTKHGVRVDTINPNSGLMNAIGLNTPFSTATQVIPWGWAINYFINVSDLISNFEVRWPGVVIGGSYSTVFKKTTYTGFYRKKTLRDVTWNPREGTKKIWNPDDIVRYNGEALEMKRRLGIPRNIPQLKFPALGSGQFANLTSAIALTMHGLSKDFPTGKRRT